MGGVEGRPVEFFFETEGSMVMASSDGRGR
jgi:hypothetical protein